MSIFDSVANLLSGQNKNQGGSLFDIVSSKLQSLTPAKNQSTVVENQQAADAAARKKTSGDIIAAIAETPVIKKLAGVKDPGKSQQDIQDYLRGKSVVESADAKGELTTFPGQQTKVFNDTSTGPLMVNAVDNYRLTGKDIRRNEDLQNAVMGAINELGPIVKGAKTVPMEIKNYVAEQTAAQEAARLAEQKTLGQRSIDLVKDAKTKFVDVNAPIEDTLAKSLKENNLTLLPSKDITNNIDRVYRAPQLAGQFAKDHGIVDVIQQAPDINELNQYLIAKQSEKVSAGGIETGRNLAQDRALVESLAPIYEPLAQKVTKYSQDLLDEVANSGLISKELAAKLKEAYPDYVPLNRIFNELEQPNNIFGSKATASISSQSIVKKLEGSTRVIDNPIDSLLIKTNDAIRQVEVNNTARQLASYKDLPGNPFQLTELKAGETAPHTISYLENGVKKTFSTTPEVATAARALNLQALNVFEKVASYPTRLAKLGITGINPAFTLANLAKDQLTGLVMSDKALYTSIANPKVFLKGLYEAIGHGKGYDELVRLGGGGTSFDIAREAVPQTVESIRAGKNLVSKIAYTIKNPSELLRTAENIVGRTEEMTRLQQYFGTKEALMKQGMSEAEASIGAARAARENTVNFARKGEFGNVMNSTMLYLNANIQGTRTFLRTISSRPGESALKIGTAVLLPTAIVTAWNLSDPKRKAAYDDIPEWERKGNFIIIPDNPTKNEDGTWNVIKIPLAPEFQNIASFVRRPLEAQQDLDPVTISEMANSLIGIVSPINPDKGSLMSTLTPQFIKPTLEVATNKNLFTGFPIVSASKEKLSPELQYGPSTTGTSKVIGNIIGASPAKIDAWIKGTVGSIAPQLLHATDMALAGLDIIPKDQIKGKSIVDAIASRFMSATGGNVENRIANKIKEAISTQADENMRLNQEAEIVYSELSKLNPNEANQKSIEIRQSRPDLFKALTQVATDDKKGLTYNDRLIQSLSVDTGNRARFIWDYVKSLPTKEEKNAYINDLRNKKIISSKVMQQLMFIKSNEK